ncbi:probable receptor-like protein kinase At1g49730 isoform X3 [Prosopis cineraria]|uniref:probable receptor-like protein kinase At1g49730 isoform X3 n=1 Tax=Prosopis cineraria TaxID=364024 RepID=UPI00240F0740|nr:probable receptor-like protein kinase At1g49730 isoform X3 [Prosopis cineraria]
MFGKLAFYFELLAFLGMQLPLTMADCPLDFTGSNFTLASSMCSNQFERGKCCRYINANIAVSVARFANVTRSLGVTLNASDPCLQTISQTLQHYGVPHNATIFCGFGTKISVNYECEGRTTVMQMLQSPRFVQVVENCKVPLAEESKCKKCLNAGINFIHHLIGIKDNITLSTCRDATFAALASQVDEMSTIDIASCFFRVQGLLKPRGPSSMFRKFNYREIKKATEDFNTIIGQGGFGTVYKAHFRDDLVLAVKRMNKVSEQGEDEFCKEIELLARLHHRHLVALRGFCVKNHERFLMYEYMENGSLKDHLHSPSKAPLSWRTRIQVAIDVANALEYLHFYCDPPLWHRDIKSSNILLDENFVAKLADFGLAHASKNGSISFEAVNTNIMGTPGYMDPEYVVTHELTEKSDIYNYGVLLLEIVTGRRAIQDNKNLVEWAQPYMGPDSVTRLMELVDPNVRESFDLDQLQTAVSIVEWCTQREGRIRPSIKQVLRLLYDTSEPMHSGFLQDIEGEECEGNQQSGRSSRGKMHRNEALFQSKDGRYLASSSSTSRSYCSKSFLLETSSPQSPLNILSVEDKYH